MDTQCTTAANSGYAVNFSSEVPGSGNGDGAMSDEDEQEDDVEQQPSGIRRTPALVQHSPPAVTAQNQSSALADWTGNSEGEVVLNSCDPYGINSKGGFGLIQLWPTALKLQILLEQDQWEHSLHIEEEAAVVKEQSWFLNRLRILHIQACISISVFFDAVWF